MLAALLLTIFGVNVYDSGSVVTMDTVSAVITMSELRVATERLQDRDLLLQEVYLDSVRHVADSSALAHARAALGYGKQAQDSLAKAYTDADKARLACVDSAAVISTSQLRHGLAIGGGIGAAVAVVTFIVGVVVGN